MAYPLEASDRASRLFTVALLVCVGILGAGLYVQHSTGLDPCPLCILHRVAYLGIAFVALVAALHRPQGIGIRLYSVAGLTVAVAGVAIAIYQLWVQADPKRVEACGRSAIATLLDESRIGEWVPPLLQYGGTCSPKPWSLLGLGIPEWSLVWFLLLALFLALVPRIAWR